MPKFPLVVLVAALLVVPGTALLGCGGSSNATLNPGESETMSVSKLEDFAENAGQDVYWAGERPDAEYEVTRRKEGGVLVRYLPTGGGGGGEVLTVGSYPVQNAAAALRRASGEQGGSQLARSDKGAVVLLDTKSPDNAHLAYPGTDLQIEIFSPVQGEALRLAARDGVEPVP